MRGTWWMRSMTWTSGVMWTSGADKPRGAVSTRVATWASDKGRRRAARLVDRALKMMCKVVLGLGHMRGCAGCIWDGGGT